MIRWTISASALILMTLGLRALTKKRLSLRLRYALWLPVLLRLLIPGSLWNLPALLVPTEAEPVSRLITRQEYPLHQTREYDPLFLEHDSQGYVILEVAEEAPTVEKASELEPAGEYTAPAVAVPTQAGETRDFKDLLPWIWAAGAGGVLAICLISELRFTLHLRRSRRPMESEAGVPVYGCAWLHSPCLTGLFRPTVYVPEQLRGRREALSHALAHELAHARHGDLLWSRLRCLALALHWFNPLVWLAVFCSKQDGELACDESAISRLGEGQRYAYGRTLLRLSCPGRNVFVPLPSMGAGGLRERIRLIGKSPKTSAWALLLAFSLSLLATGCSFSEGEKQSEQWYYQSEYRSLELPVETVYAQCIAGERVYLAAKEDEAAPRIYSFSLTGEDRREFSLPELTLPGIPAEAVMQDVLIQMLLPGAEDSFYVLGSLVYTVADGEEIKLNDDSTMRLEQWYSADFALCLDAEGETRALFPYPCENILAPCTDAAGRLYAMDADNSLHIFSPEGEELLHVPVRRYPNQFLRLPDGRAAIAVTQEGGTEVLAIDPGTGSLNPVATVPEQLTSSVMEGAFDWELLVNNGTMLYGVRGDGERETLVTWLNCDLDGNKLLQIQPGSDGESLICLFGEPYGRASSYGLALIRRTDVPPPEDRTVLTLACMGLDDSLADLVLHFNRTNRDYRIEVRDYSSYNTTASPDAGYTMLNTEIAAGEVPDLLCTRDLPYRSYARQGLLEDLWPYIEADTELGGRDALMLPLFEAMSQEGKLYQVSPFFYLYTVVGAESIVGKRAGWTMEEFQAVCDTLPEDCDILSPYFTRESALNAALCLGLDAFVDWDSGTCAFDSAEFRDLIRFAGQFPAEPMMQDGVWRSDYDRMIAGEQLLSYVCMTDFSSPLFYNACLNGEAVYVGFPGAGGNGSAFDVPMGLAMSATCAHKEEAWLFLRTTLNRDWQASAALQYGFGGENFPLFPTNREAFDKILEQVMRQEYQKDEHGAYILDGNGERIPQMIGSFQDGEGGRLYGIYPLTQEEADRFLQLVESTSCMRYWDDAIMDIVWAELPACFSGEKTPEQAMANIQKRVTLYLEELK